MKRVSQQEQRLQVSRIFLDTTVQHLNESVQERTSERAFNSDKIDVSDWEDRKTRKVIVPATMRYEMISHGISRNVARFRVGPKGAHEAWCAIRNEFGSEVESEAIHQHEKVF
jgi:hypothetical protein